MNKEDTKQIMGAVIEAVNKSMKVDDWAEVLINFEQQYATLQSRRSELRKLINDTHVDIDLLKDYEQILYIRSTPETEIGRYCFYKYKEVRKEIKQNNKKLKTLVGLQLDVKNQMKQISELIRMVNSVVNKQLFGDKNG